MNELDEGFQALLELGQWRGYLTFEEINRALPDEADDHDQLKTAALIKTIVELGIDLCDVGEVQDRLAAPDATASSPAASAPNYLDDRDDFFVART